MASVYVQTEYAALFQGLTGDSIVQTNRAYEEDSIYQVTFTPVNRVQASKPTIYFNYPSSVKAPESDLREIPDPDDTSGSPAMIKAGTCTVRCGEGAEAESSMDDCVKRENSRQFQIKRAIPEDYGGIRYADDLEEEARNVEAMAEGPEKEIAKLGLQTTCLDT